MTLEEERLKVYETVGRAISNWGALEVVLAMLFSVLVSKQRVNPNALAVFLSIENFRSKLQVIDAVFQQPGIDKKIKNNWDTALSHIKARQKKRNRLAHHDILIDYEAKEMHRVKVIPPFANPINRIKMDNGTERPLCLKDLQDANAEFTKVRQEVLELTALLDTPAPLQKK